MKVELCQTVVLLLQPRVLYMSSSFKLEVFIQKKINLCWDLISYYVILINMWLLPTDLYLFAFCFIIFIP